MDYSREGLQKAGVGPRIRQMREDAGIRTLKKFSKLTGLHLNTLSNIETGTSGSSLDSLTKIANALRCSLNDLFQPPLHAPQPASVAAFLERFRSEKPTLFQNWTPEMWRRYIEVGVRFAVANGDCAQFFARQVEVEYQCHAKVRDIFDAGCFQAEVVTAIGDFHTRSQRELQKKAIPVQKSS